MEMLRDDILPNCGDSADTDCVEKLVNIVEQCSRVRVCAAARAHACVRDGAHSTASPACERGTDMRARPVPGDWGSYRGQPGPGLRIGVCATGQEYETTRQIPQSP